MPGIFLKDLAAYFPAFPVSAPPVSALEPEPSAAGLRQEHYAAALRHLDRMPWIGHDPITAAVERASLYMAAGKPGMAIPCLEWATALRRSPAIRRALAEAYRENGEWIRAVAEYEKVLNAGTDPQWVREQIIELTRQKLSAAEAFPVPGTVLPYGTPIRPDTLVLLPPESRCAIVEKESQTLFLYRNTARGYELEKAFACSTGARPGEKTAQGDEKTPEGIYRFQMVVPRNQLPDLYGKKAITLDYPNAFDRLEGKGGDGIWLHATNEPLRAYLPNKTRGCVVVSNEDIEELSALLTLNGTPLIIVPRIRYSSGPELNRDMEDIRDFLSEWRSAWERKDVGRYVSMYSPRFRNGDLDLNGWKSFKEAVFSRAGKILVLVELQSVVRNERYATVTFRQAYESDRTLSEGTKRLFLVRENREWKIIAEEMDETGTGL